MLLNADRQRWIRGTAPIACGEICPLPPSEVIYEALHHKGAFAGSPVDTRAENKAKNNFCRPKKDLISREILNLRKNLSEKNS